MKNINEKLNEILSLPAENEVVEWKEAKNDFDFPPQSIHIDPLDCPSIGGAVLGASSDNTSVESGKVLGDSTSVLAATGTFSDTLALMTRIFGGFILGLIFYRKLMYRS